MADPIFFRLMVLLAKLEGTYATDPTLTGAANAMLAKNVSINPMDGEDVSLDRIRSYLSNQGTIPTGLRVSIEFDTEIAGSGEAGTAPAWGVLMRGIAGCAEVIVEDTSVTYSPISEAMESIYIKFWLGNTLHAIKGSRGNPVATLNAQAAPVIRWSVTGLFVDPTETSRATPTLSAFVEPLLVTNTNTTFMLNEVPLVMRNFSLDLGNQVEPRLLVGRENVVISDRGETITIAVEAVPLSTFNPFALAKARTLVPVTLVHGTAAGNICTINAPTCQVQRPGGYQNNQGVAEWPLSLKPQPDAGNDQFSIVFT
jgi:hypothetical protein